MLAIEWKRFDISFRCRLAQSNTRYLVSAIWASDVANMTTKLERPTSRLSQPFVRSQALPPTSLLLYAYITFHALCDPYCYR